ncbi:hypothetical protein B0H13DRAFT_1880512 [Mycena leptocephala]|nr:hypothetical protein B0H13DRAFT_1880512 [Mycena leptocephala]
MNEAHEDRGETADLSGYSGAITDVFIKAVLQRVLEFRVLEDVVGPFAQLSASSEKKNGDQTDPANFSTRGPREAPGQEAESALKSAIFGPDFRNLALKSAIFRPKNSKVSPSIPLFFDLPYRSFPGPLPVHILHPHQLRWTSEEDEGRRGTNDPPARRRVRVGIESEIPHRRADSRTGRKSGRGVHEGQGLRVHACTSGYGRGDGKEDVNDPGTVDHEVLCPQNGARTCGRRTVMRDWRKRVQVARRGFKVDGCDARNRRTSEADGGQMGVATCGGSKSSGGFGTRSEWPPSSAA